VRRRYDGQSDARRLLHPIDRSPHLAAQSRTLSRSASAYGRDHVRERLATQQQSKTPHPR
jgi:hypothetical protein